MGWINRLFRSNSGKKKIDREIDKELRFHIDQLTKGNIAAGMSPEQARRAALIEFGGPQQITEECRQARSVQWVDDLLQDLRFGLRTLRQDPGYTFAAIMALGLGIGANTALFTLYNNVALQPMPVPEANRVVELYKTTPQFPNPVPIFTYPEYLYYREHSAAFEEISTNYPAHLRMSDSVTGPSATSASIPAVSASEQLQGSAERVMGLFVSSSYFSMMRVNPVAGSSFLPEDDRKTAPPYSAMLSENFWERRFGRDTNIIGKSLRFSGIQAVIIGITPRDFMGAQPHVPDVWFTLAAQEDPRRREQDRTSLCCGIEGRIKPGVTVQQAQLELARLTESLHRDFPENDQRSSISLDIAKPAGQAGKGVSIIYGAILQPAVGMVLLIACANVAGLLLGRAASRQKEIAVRLSLGATRGRLIRQLVTESVLMAQLAGFLSLLLTWWILKILVRVAISTLESSGMSDGGTLLVKVTPDIRVLLYTLSVSLLTGIAFALVPALQATRPNLTTALKEEVVSFGVRSKSRFHGWLVATQVAVCLMLLIGAGTLVNSSIRLLTTDPGFETKRVVSVSLLNPEELGYTTARAEALKHQLESLLPTVPGVQSIASASRVPLGGNVWRTTVTEQGSSSADPQARRYPLTFVSAGYFETLGITLLQGRGFTQQEVSNHSPVAIISDVLAKQLWPNQSAIGRRITVGSRTQTSFQFQRTPFFESSEIIGVARNVYSDSMLAPDPGAAYLPSQTVGWDGNMFIRTQGDPRTVVGALSGELQSIDRNLSATLQTMDSVMKNDSGFLILRIFGIIFSLIGLLGLALASVGIYSMVGYAVRRQTREIGIRMALGAQKSDVLRLIIGRSMQPIGAGVVVGIALGVIVSLLLSSLFQGLKLLDAGVLTGISTFLIIVAIAAAYIPTRRAMRLDPCMALRCE